MSNLSPLERRAALGQTFLSHFDHCRRSAYLYRTVNARSHEMDRGTVYHAAKERGILLMVEQEEATIPVELAKALLEEELAAHPELTVPWREVDGLRYMVAHWAQAWDVPPERVLGVEVELGLELGGYLLRGRLDVVLRSSMERVLEVRDWKTSFAMPDQAAFDGSFQPWFYGMLAMFGTMHDGSCLGDRQEFVDVAECYPRFLREDGTLASRSMVRSRLELEEFRQHIEGLLVKLDGEWERQEWPAVSGSHCSICPASRECPIPAAERRHAGRINTLEEAAEAAEWAERVRDDLKATDKELALWAKANGPIRFGRDLVLEHVMQESRALKRRGQSSDWEGLQQAVVSAVEYGEPFELGEWVQERTSMKFKRRVLTPEEAAA